MPNFLASDFNLLLDSDPVNKWVAFDLSLIAAGGTTVSIPGTGVLALADGNNLFTGINSFDGPSPPVFYAGIHIADTGDFTALLSIDPTGIATGTTRTWNALDADIVVAGSASALTSGRVPFVTTGGLLVDDADLTFATDTLSATKIVAPTSLQVGGGAVLTALTAGTYTPTRSAEANLDANVTPSQAQYLRVGNTVTVSGRFTADPTTTLTATSFELSLPVASNIGAVEDCAGVAFCGAISGQGAAISGSVANNTAVFSWVAADVTSQSWSYHFSYEVI